MSTPSPSASKSSSPTASSNRIQIFLVDDHPIVRLGFRRVIEDTDRLTVVGEAGSSEEALEKISEAQPDVALIDVTMKGMDGIELTRRLKQSHPELRVLIVSMHDETYYVDEALKAGADGYVLKDNIDKLMTEAVDAVRRGQSYICNDVKSRRG